MQERLYEILAITFRYWYVLLIGYAFLVSLNATLRAEQDGEGSGVIVFITVLLTFSGLGLLSIRESATINMDVIILSVLAVSIFLIQYFLLRLVFKGLDNLLLLITNILFMLGLIMLQRLSPNLARNQVEWFGVGSLALMIFIIITSRLKKGKKLIYLLMLTGVSLLALPLVFGEVIGGAKNWITIKIAGKELGFQPSELVKVILIFVFAIEFSHEKTFKERLPTFLFTGLCMLILVLSRDLGGALHFFMVFMFIYPIATSDIILTLSAGSTGAVASIFAYHMFSHVKVRVEAWRNPWAAIEDKGYQIAHALIAIGSGGLLGSGLGLGIPYIIPASRTDLIFAAICEEMGILIGFMVIGFYAMMTVRGTYVAQNSQDKLDCLLAMGATVSLAIQSFIIIGGVIKLIPLTGVTMPFVSYGGSSMVASFSMIGIIEGVAMKTYRQQINDEQAGEGEDG